MGLKKKPQMVEAVLFFNEQGGIGKQMMFTEFEALLDGVVNIAEFADQQKKVAYVLITPRLLVKSVVCFYLDFDEDGAPDRGWNIPLQLLADKAQFGPDLGGGPIRLVSRDNCSVSSHHHFLWEPDFAAQKNELVLLAEAVKRNSLGILVEEEPRGTQAALNIAGTKDDTQLRLDRDQRMKNAELLKQQRQLLETLTREHEAELGRLKDELQQQSAGFHQQIARLQSELSQQQAENAALRVQIAELQAESAAQAARFQASRKEMGDQLRSLEQDARQETEQLRMQFERVMQDKLDKLQAQHKEQLSIRDVEMAYLHEQDGHNQQEIKRLTEANTQLLTQGGLRYLEGLNALGVMFVVYHPGAGHLTIPIQDIAHYQDNPMAYAASKCFVSEEQYRLWVEHYQQPTCIAVMANGERCAIPLDRVDVPGRFIAGESNCCSRHKTGARLRSAG
ncbi:chromosome partitioning protein ParA [Ectopseudomonas mendocina]|uniref:Chromosome partitioning protein ParA n=1 Tax=Ectopseudomonas mendocina TaxID=300 RepID=A0ABZ2REF9_ECTME